MPQIKPRHTVKSPCFQGVVTKISASTRRNNAMTKRLKKLHPQRPKITPYRGPKSFTHFQHEPRPKTLFCDRNRFIKRIKISPYFKEVNCPKCLKILSKDFWGFRSVLSKKTATFKQVFGKKTAQILRPRKQDPSLGSQTVCLCAEFLRPAIRKACSGWAFLQKSSWSPAPCKSELRGWVDREHFRALKLERRVTL